MRVDDRSRTSPHGDVLLKRVPKPVAPLLPGYINNKGQSHRGERGDVEITEDIFGNRWATGVIMMVDQQTKADCWLACIASLTGLFAFEMPQPPTSYEDLTAGSKPIDEDFKAEVLYGNAVLQYLREHGWLLLPTYKFAPAGYSIASGPSPRNPHIYHCVVYLAGQL